jgi:hypothetical protein
MLKFKFSVQFFCLKNLYSCNSLDRLTVQAVKQQHYLNRKENTFTCITFLIEIALNIKNNNKIAMTAPVVATFPSFPDRCPLPELWTWRRRRWSPRRARGRCRSSGRRRLRTEIKK